jgi:hypothetical protein
LYVKYPKSVWDGDNGRVYTYNKWHEETAQKYA